MIALLWFTMQQIVLQRKMILSVLLLAFPSAVLILMREFGELEAQEGLWNRFHEPTQYLILMIVVPLVCMLQGTTLISAEIEQRTIALLITRRLRRSTVLLVRCLGAWIVLTLLVQLGLVALYFAAFAGVELSAATYPVQVVRALPDLAGQSWHPLNDLVVYLLVTPAAVAGYLAMFTMLSLIAPRPLLASVLFIIAFELTLANLPFAGRIYTISHQIRQTLVWRMPAVQVVYAVPDQVAEIIYVDSPIGLIRLGVALVVLLAAACALMTWRELVPGRLARD
jgi:hypothetical protein